MVNLNEPIVKDGNFEWHEYLRLKEWAEFVTPTAEQIKNAVFLFTELQKLRKELGQPLYITSGIRSMAYTKWLRKRGIPAALGSAHLSGQAVDLAPPKGMTTRQFWNWCHKRWPGRMEAFESTPTWVHLDTRDWGKRVRFKP